jgi:transcriptional regulator
MYLPHYHALTERDALFALMEAHPLAAWVSQCADGLVANHIPWVLDRSRGAHGTLVGHVARGNTVWRQLAQGAPSVVMFTAAQSYISPGWYPGKSAHGKVVPTWNYAVVHAHGSARAVHDRAWLLDMLQRLTQAQEAQRATPWQVRDAPVDYIDRLLGAIVGIEIPIDRLEGRNKASQDEDLADRQGTVRGLRTDGGEQQVAVAQRVAQALEDEGHSVEPGFGHEIFGHQIRL